MQTELDRSAAGHSISLRLPGNFAGVRTAATELRQSMLRNGFPDREIMRVEIAVTEALNNVVEHALRNARQGIIRLTAHAVGDRYHVTILDDGAAMPGLSLPDAEYPPVDVPVEDLPEGGFGWALLSSLTSRMDYSRRNGVNTLTLEFGAP